MHDPETDRPPSSTRVGGHHLPPRGALAITAVAAILLALQPARAEEPMRGVVRAINQAALSTDIPMRLIRLPFREGHAFRAGEIIAEFDCRRSEAERQAVGGMLREAQLNLEANIKLEGYRAIGRHEIEVSRARLEKARGEHRLIEARIADCVVQAPFTGRVAEAPVRVWEFTVAQRPYLAIVEDGNFELDFILPSRLLSRTAVGQQLDFRVDELPGEIGKAVVTAVGPTVDPVSKTGKITARVLLAPAAMAAGMSCVGTLPSERRQALP